MGRYNLFLTPCNGTAEKYWSKRYATQDRLADLQQYINSFTQEQTWEIHDTKKNEVISKEKYFQIVT